MYLHNGGPRANLQRLIGIAEQPQYDAVLTLHELAGLALTGQEIAAAVLSSHMLMLAQAPRWAAANVPRANKVNPKASWARTLKTESSAFSAVFTKCSARA